MCIISVLKWECTCVCMYLWQCLPQSSVILFEFFLLRLFCFPEILLLTSWFLILSCISYQIKTWSKYQYKYFFKELLFSVYIRICENIPSLIGVRSITTHKWTYYIYILIYTKVIDMLDDRLTSMCYYMRCFHC